MLDDKSFPSKKTSKLLLLLSFFLLFCQESQCQSLSKTLKRIFGERSQDEPRECIHDDITKLTIKFDNENEFINCFPKTMQMKNWTHPNHNKRTDEIILQNGYPVETYKDVQTDDGYLISVHRIPGGPTSPPKVGKPAVMLVHGMAEVSDVWFMQNGTRNLAFKLVAAGYDVWLPNLRGSDLSRGHVKYDPNVDIDAYWDFSFHEMGIFDFPKVLDLMLQKTGNEKIFFIGHSMAPAIYAIAMSEKPELNEKIEASFFLAPALYMGHSYSLFRMITGLMELSPLGQQIFKIIVRGRLQIGNRLTVLNSKLCAPTAVRCGVCEHIIFFIFGYDAPQLDYGDIPVILEKVFNTVSLETLKHFGQNWKTCTFRKRDLGYSKNMELYGQPQPPSYDLSKLSAPIYIYYGDADNFVPPVDVKMTRDAIPEGVVKGFFRVDWKWFNHMDFLTAKDADKLVYDSILDIMQKYTNSTINNVVK